MPRLNNQERDAFLETPGVLMRIACVRADGSPLVTPVWFIYRDGAIHFTPRARSEWLDCLRRDPRVALCIDEQPHPYRKVLLEGSARFVHDIGEDDAWRDLYRAIAKRYVPPDAAERYIQDTLDQPRALLRLALADASVKTWRMPRGDEPVEGIWHDRYYGQGTRFKRTD
ncbi:MAG: pyridoxamine 5'-phosphate oxidase family protein [Proteobacteria bacterium]|jgi:PPOX class probable F420-dependent enzyme|nr:pyridoxamine 5'-phosphate oxidase family protein [Pseudomonadota bacterium]MDA1299481.1 pyridoxamine 5'-phosphate oxidase family protein [Pseudomonadota bacterium]